MCHITISTPWGVMDHGIWLTMGYGIWDGPAWVIGCTMGYDTWDVIWTMGYIGGTIRYVMDHGIWYRPYAILDAWTMGYVHDLWTVWYGMDHGIWYMDYGVWDGLWDMRLTVLGHGMALWDIWLCFSSCMAHSILWTQHLVISHSTILHSSYGSSIC